MTLGGGGTADTRTAALIDDLRKLPAETSWVEFKENNTDPQMIGKLISALSNAARQTDQHFAYLIWGVRDEDPRGCWTSFEPTRQMQQGQPLELWLGQRLQPDIAFPSGRFITMGRGSSCWKFRRRGPARSNSSALLTSASAARRPRLSDHPERLKALWAKLQPYVWESGDTVQFLTGDEVLARLDYPVYFELMGQPLPDNRNGIFDRLVADRLVRKDVGGHWNITNLGAILFARRLGEFPPAIARKAVRLVAYDGLNRAATVTHRLDGHKGYASGFDGLRDHIDGLLPQNERIGKAFREAVPLYPSIAIRELIANALIHQDMTITVAGPLVELFADRVEITNPGRSLIPPERFLDSPPRSRNEALASLMRRMNICEEQGTGIDKVLVAVEQHHLPPPDFRNEGEAVRVVLYAPRRFADMTPEERVRACYQHAGLRYVSGQRMKNATLCERFGIDPHNAAQASGVIRQSLDAGLIRPADAAHPRAGYVPSWA